VISVTGQRVFSVRGGRVRRFLALLIAEASELCRRCRKGITNRLSFVSSIFKKFQNTYVYSSCILCKRLFLFYLLLRGVHFYL